MFIGPEGWQLRVLQSVADAFQKLGKELHEVAVTAIHQADYAARHPDWEKEQDETYAVVDKLLGEEEVKAEREKRSPEQS